MSGHTPGPWCATNKEYGTWKTDVRAKEDGSGRRVLSTFALNSPSKKRGETREAYRERYDSQARQNEANAILAATAPELLEAAQIAVMYIETTERGAGIKRLLETVIAKATTA